MVESLASASGGVSRRNEFVTCTTCNDIKFAHVSTARRRPQERKVLRPKPLAPYDAYAASVHQARRPLPARPPARPLSFAPGTMTSSLVKSLEDAAIITLIVGVVPGTRNPMPPRSVASGRAALLGDTRRSKGRCALGVSSGSGKHEERERERE